MMDVSDDLKEEFQSSMLHDNMSISILWCMPSMWKSQGLRGRVEMLRGQDLFMEVLQTIGLIYKTRLDYRRGFLIMFLTSSLRLVVIGCPTIILVREKVLLHQSRSQLVESVARSTMVIFLRERTIVLVMVKVGTRLGISQI